MVIIGTVIGCIILTCIGEAILTGDHNNIHGFGGGNVIHTYADGTDNDKGKISIRFTEKNSSSERQKKIEFAKIFFYITHILYVMTSSNYSITNDKLAYTLADEQANLVIPLLSAHMVNMPKEDRETTIKAALKASCLQSSVMAMLTASSSVSTHHKKKGHKDKDNKKKTKKRPRPVVPDEERCICLTNNGTRCHVKKTEGDLCYNHIRYQKEGREIKTIKDGTIQEMSDDDTQEMTDKITLEVRQPKLKKRKKGEKKSVKITPKNDSDVDSDGDSSDADDEDLLKDLGIKG